MDTVKNILAKLAISFSEGKYVPANFHSLGEAG
jgi:hypothetical protein